MDQTAPAHQSVLRHQRERREDSNLDRRLDLCAGGHRSQAPWAREESKSLYQILQIFSITGLEKVPILQVFEAFDSQSELLDNSNQLTLFGL